MSNNIYFDEHVENLVIEYRDEETSERRKRQIYSNELYPIFDKMIRVIIHRRKIHNTGEELESLISETNVHLWEVLNNSNFNPEYGRAYSYFTKTIHNYLYQKQKAHQKMISDYGLYSINDDENYYIETFYEEEDDFDMAELLKFFKDWLNDNVDDLFDPEIEEEEMRIAYAISNILNSDDSGIEKSKHFTYSIFQQTGINNNYRINKVIHILKDKYFEMKEEYSKTYYIEDNE